MKPRRSLGGRYVEFDYSHHQAHRPRAQVLDFTIGRTVYAHGRTGVIESTAFSVATQTTLYTVAFSPRERHTFRADELSVA